MLLAIVLLTQVVMFWEKPAGLGSQAVPFPPTCCVWTGPVLWIGVAGYKDGDTGPTPIYRYAWASYYPVPDDPGCPGPPPTVTRTEETDPAVTLDPVANWNPNSSATVGVILSGDRMVASGLPGTTATFAFSGTGASWIGFPCEICGIADVLIDGTKVASVDTYQPRPRPAASVVLYTSPALPHGPHTLAVVVTGGKNPASGNPYIVVDAFDAETFTPSPSSPLCTSLLPAPARGEALGYVIPEE